jgi:hypothetical protein
MKTVTLQCENCNNSFKKKKGEYNRRVRLGKKKFYCSLSCCSKTPENLKHLKRVQSNFPVWELANPSQEDEYSKFRPILKMLRDRCSRKNGKDLNITLEYLKNLWEAQNGQCPFTKFNLELRSYKSQTDKKLSIKSASLDRIDNNLGYIEGNVRWVSVMFNYAKNVFSDQDVIDFANAVTNGGERLSTGNTG